MAEQKSTQNPADIIRAIAAGGSLATHGIQTDPEVREVIGQAIMTSMLCTHEFQEMVCGVCWESTQRIGKALVLALPQLQIPPSEPPAKWQEVSETYRVIADDRIRAEYINDQQTVETKTVTADQDKVAIRHLFASAHPVGRYSILLRAS